jgi:hypothetical protein
MLAAFEWAKDRNDRARIAATWAFWSILVQVVLALLVRALTFQ